MKTLDDILQSSDTVVAITQFSSHLIIATQRNLYKVWSEGNTTFCERMVFEVRQ